MIRPMPAAVSRPFPDHTDLLRRFGLLDEDEDPKIVSFEETNIEVAITNTLQDKNTVFCLATKPKTKKFTGLIIQKLWFYKFSCIRYHWDIHKIQIISGA